eukprot:COSAG04_NODE_6834_length_1246_cov_0.939843_1_plen_43_part_10
MCYNDTFCTSALVAEQQGVVAAQHNGSDLCLLVLRTIAASQPA